MWHYFQPCHSLVDFLLCYVKLSDIQMLNLILGHLFLAIKFEYSEKAAKFCKISTLLLFTVHTDKSKVKILQDFVAFSEYMNFNLPFFWSKVHQMCPNSNNCNSLKIWFKQAPFTSEYFLPDCFTLPQLTVKPSDIELLIAIFWLRACRSDVFSGFFQQSQDMLDLLKIFI